MRQFASRIASFQRPRAERASRAPAPRATSGLPRYLKVRPAPGALAQSGHATREREARASANDERSRVAPGYDGSASPSLLERGLAASARLGPAGERLDARTQRLAEGKTGAGLDEVRVHADAHASGLARSVGANALAVGRDIYFAEGRYQPGTREGDRLIAHEAAHVVQHGASAAAVDADLMATHPTPLGYFEIEMADRVPPATPGMEGTIRFFPDPGGPYSAEIGLIQAARLLDVSGARGAAGSPWRFVTPGEANRNVLGTTGSAGEAPGWHVDTTYSDPAKTQSSAVSPSYPESVGFSPNNLHGWLRSPTDFREASLYDYPGFAGPPIDYEFETVAKAMDSPTVYGALHWGFKLRAAGPTDEYASAVPTASTEFDIALERFRTFFTHEPVVVYFDTDVDTPNAAEAAKLGEVTSWMAAHSDVHLEIEGFADERGRAGHNLGLSQRRADMVAALLIARGADASRIDSAVGRGETTGFAAGSDAGKWQANRRVRIRFVRTASEAPAP